MLYIGIDPSINSTGVVVRKTDYQHNLIFEKFFIIKPNKLSKKEQKFQDSSDCFEYVIYEKTDIKDIKKYDNHKYEYEKTLNIYRIVECLRKILYRFVLSPDDTIISMEGISYGSASKTSAIYDLAGLNYLIRSMIINLDVDVTLNICTPAEVKKYASGMGNCTKDVLSHMFLKIHPEFNEIKKVDDIADAYFMSCISEYQ